MNILFIIDPLESLHLETDTTFAMAACAKRRKNRVWICGVHDLSLQKNTPFAFATELEKIQSGRRKTWEKGKSEGQPLAAFQCILMRKDPPVTTDYIMATSLLSLVDRKKTLVVNEPELLRNFNEKLGILQFPKYIPETMVSKRRKDFIDFLQEHRMIVLKPLEGYGGHEIIVLDTKDKNRNSLLEMLTRHETRFVMAQRYLSEVKYGDRRVLLLDGEILGVQNRVAAADDHRSNISAGGSSHKGSLTPHERKIAEHVGAVLKKQGGYFIGLDLIGEYITEINVTSPTGLVKINEHDGVRLEENVLQWIEKKIP